MAFVLLKKCTWGLKQYLLLITVNDSQSIISLLTNSLKIFGLNGNDAFRVQLRRKPIIWLESFIIRPDHIWAQRKPMASGEVRAVLWMNSDLQFYHHILILISEFQYWAKVSSQLKVISQNISLYFRYCKIFRGLQSILWQDGEWKPADEIKLRRNDKERRRRRDGAVPWNSHPQLGK